MAKFFSEQVKDIVEMAAPKLLPGVKKKPSTTYHGAHNISVDGEHVATVDGYKPSRGRGAHTQYGKVYHVHKDEPTMKDWQQEHQGHEDHRELETHHFANYGKDGKQDPEQPHVAKQVYRPRTYGSMEDALHAVVSAHRNNQEFGKGHDPKTRWAHAIKLASGHEEHEAKSIKYRSALQAAKELGHDDVTEKLQHHADAHAASSSKPSDEKIKQWTHDAHHYVKTKHVPGVWKDGVKHSSSHEAPVHPEHKELAQQAINVAHYGHPDGSHWEREHIKREALQHGGNTARY